MICNTLTIYEIHKEKTNKCLRLKQPVSTCFDLLPNQKGTCD